MFSLRFLSLTLAYLFINQNVILSQCPECTPDTTCGEGASFPTICPETLQTGTSGEYYEEVMTFYLPSEVEDQGITATLDEIVITSISGVPFGMEITVNDDDNTFYPNEGDNYGCATLCGTPLQDGVFDVTINVLVTVTAFGFEQVVGETFSLPLTINEGELSNTSFSFDNAVGCGELEVNFSALIDGSPNPTTYAWDFGNGNLSDQASPTSQLYDTPGTYTAVLETTIYEFVLDQVIINSVSNDGDNDLDELFGALAPDPYIVILDENGVVVYTSSSVDGSDSATFSDLGIIVSNSGYTIQVWDSDSITADDFLGEYSLGTLSDGVFNFNDGGTEGSASVIEQINSQFIDEQIINVFEIPNGDFEYIEASNSLLYEDPSLVGFIWFLNGEILINQTPEQIIEGPGIYQCMVTNEFGCTAMSEEFIVCPEVDIVVDYDNETFFISDGYESYSWSYNGLVIENSDVNEIDYQGPGNYAVEITTSYGCEVSSEVLTIDLNVESISKPLELIIYPNPAEDGLSLKSQGINRQVKIQVIDNEGKVCMNSPLTLLDSAPTVIDVSEFSSGLFTIVVSDKNQTLLNKRFIKK